MPFDDKKFYSTATNSDVAAIAIQVSLGLSTIAFALEALARGDKDDLKKEIASIRKSSDELDEMFTTLTGYTEK